MQIRTITATSAAFAVTLLALAGRSAVSAGQSGALVRLQATTPGTTQAGNAHINGTMMANSFEGVHGGFENYSTSGTAVSAIAWATSGPTTGGHFRAESPSAHALDVVASATTGSPYTAYLWNASPSGVGLFSATQGGTTVYGLNYYSSGSTTGVLGRVSSPSGRGVNGWNDNTGANSTPYGVYGLASAATLGYGVFAAGDSGASGVKSFRIDHPQDPANKYLLHYSSESPFPQNFYNGNVTTDEKGYAWVELPSYFQDINKNFKYVLTVVDDEDNANFVQAKVSKKIDGTRFQIRTSAAHVEVSWMVFADRNDLRIQTNRPTDERPKTGVEKGKYQNPEYYGLPPEMGISYQPEPQVDNKGL